MAGSGPPPNPLSRRQATAGQAQTWTDLPADGYAGPVPEWPLLPLLSDDAERLHDYELARWATIWCTPQAAAWIRNGWLHDVALYVRYLVAGETGDLKAASEARMWSDRLGLNPAAMLKNRWRIPADEVAEKRTRKAAPKTAARRRLKVADSGVAGA